MKKLIILILIGSIITAQPLKSKSPLSQKNIPNNQGIRTMIYDTVISQSINMFDDPTTGRPTKNVDQIWENNEWINDGMTEYIYSTGKIKRDKIKDLKEQMIYVWNQTGKLSTGTTNPSGTWQYIANINYEWDNDGNLTEVTYSDDSGNPWRRDTYSGPFVNGQPAEKIVEGYDNGWTYGSRNTYTYNSNDCLEEEILHAHTGGGNWANFTRIQYYYDQGCCPTKWVFSGWYGGVWNLSNMATFTYGDCMTDMVPFTRSYSYFVPYLYLCNPTLVLMGWTTDGVNITTETSREEFTYTDCLLMTYIMYNYLLASPVQMQQVDYTYGQTTGKVSSTYDNLNQRMTSSVTQNDGVNVKRSWYSYEGLSMSAESEIGIPTYFSLKQNYPNPFNPSTTIAFDLSEDSNVNVLIYDIQGRLIRELLNQTMTIGSHTLNWDGKDYSGNSVNGGVYFYNLQIDDFNQTKKMVLLK